MPQPDARETPFTTPRRSSLARLQQAMVLGALVFAVVWLLVWWPRSPVLAAVGAALALGGYTLVLAIEGTMSTWVNRADPAPRLSWVGVVGAWWQEVRMGLKVFAWRQPFRWATLPDDVVHTPNSASPAVVFVHGFVCNRGFWLPWMRQLRAQGVPYTSVNLEPVFGGIDDYVLLVSDAVRRAHALTGRPPLLVCHSMGGLVARAWAAMEPETAVLGVVTIGSPHRGTWLGRFSHVTNGRQMRVGGDWLGALFAREAQIRPAQTYERFMCWYSNGDSIVFPASTATLPGADNRHVPGVPHVALAFHPRVMDESLAMLASADKSPSARTAS